MFFLHSRFSISGLTSPCQSAYVFPLSLIRLLTVSGTMIGGKISAQISDLYIRILAVWKILLVILCDLKKRAVLSLFTDQLHPRDHDLIDKLLDLIDRPLQHNLDAHLFSFQIFEIGLTHRADYSFPFFSVPSKRIRFSISYRYSAITSARFGT